jgi:hypothetical protein
MIFYQLHRLFSIKLGLCTYGFLACVMTSVAAFHCLCWVSTLVLFEKYCVEILAQITESEIQTLQGARFSF